MIFKCLMTSLFLITMVYSVPLCDVQPISQPPKTTETPLEIRNYEYTETDNGYMFSYSVSFFIHREETYEVKNKGTPEEEVILNGFYSFKAEDGYRYFIKYTIDKNGTNIDVSRAPVNRIPPNVLKSLVG